MSAVERGGLLCACRVLLCDVLHCTLGNVVLTSTPVL
ncbi:mCG147587 [Mus musculus]|nr:mCG147587 [Mus musculus]